MPDCYISLAAYLTNLFPHLTMRFSIVDNSNVHFSLVDKSAFLNVPYLIAVHKTIYTTRILAMINA